jgi:hypothetical protein
MSSNGRIGPTLDFQTYRLSGRVFRELTVMVIASRAPAMIASSVISILLLRSWPHVRRIAARSAIAVMRPFHIGGKRPVVEKFPCDSMCTYALVANMNDSIGIARNTFPGPTAVNAPFFMVAPMHLFPKHGQMLFVAPRVMARPRTESSSIDSQLLNLKGISAVGTQQRCSRRMACCVLAGPRTVHPCLYTGSRSSEKLSAPVTCQRHCGPFPAGPASIRTKQRGVFARSLDFKMRKTELAEQENSWHRGTWHGLNLHTLRKAPQGIVCGNQVEAGLSGATLAAQTYKYSTKGAATPEKSVLCG